MIFVHLESISEIRKPVQVDQFLFANLGWPEGGCSTLGKKHCLDLFGFGWGFSWQPSVAGVYAIEVDTTRNHANCKEGWPKPSLCAWVSAATSHDLTWNYRYFAQPRKLTRKLC